MAANFDRVAHEYDTTRGGAERGGRYAAELEPLLPAAGRLLDLGVGTGLVAAGLLQRGFHVIGADISHLMLQRAATRTRLLVRADAALLPFADASFDAVYSVWLLHLVPDVGAVLREVARVLRPGGRYLVMPSGDIAHDPIADLVAAMGRRLNPDRPPDADEGLPHAAGRNGLVHCGMRVSGPSEFVLNPHEEARLIESRSYSSLWSASEQQWRDIVEPTIRALRELPDTPQQVRRRHRIHVLEREAGEIEGG